MVFMAPRKISEGSGISGIGWRAY